MYSALPLTPYETAELARIEARPDETIHRNRSVADASGTRAYTVRGDGAVIDCAARKFKYGIGVSEVKSEGVLIKNVDLQERSSPSSIYGAGIMGDGTNTGYGASEGDVHISNAYINLGLEPDPTYKVANVDGITIEMGHKMWRVRETAIINPADAGIDGKSPYEVDASVIVGGHRCLRYGWNNGVIRIANSLILARRPHKSHFWGGNSSDGIVLEYFNCMFGFVGDDVIELMSAPLIEQENARVEVRKLDRDPFDRSAGSFWAGSTFRSVAGLIKGDMPAPQPPPATTPNRDELLGRAIREVVKLLA